MELREVTGASKIFVIWSKGATIGTIWELPENKFAARNFDEKQTKVVSTLREAMEVASQGER